MRTITALLILSAIAFASRSSAELIPEIVFESEATKVGVGEVFEVTIEVSTEGKKPEKIILPSFSGFQIISKNVSTPIQVSFHLGQGIKMTYSTRYDIALRALKEGKYKIGPVIVKVDGKDYQSHTITVEVTTQPQLSAPGRKSPQGGWDNFPDSFFNDDFFKDFQQFDKMWKKRFDRFFTTPSQPQQQSPRKPPEKLPPPPPGLDGANVDQYVFLRAVIAPEKVYVGQQATLTLYLYSKVNVSNIEITETPSGASFWTKDLLPLTGNIEFSPVQVNGEIYNVATLRKIAFFPTEAGKLTISPARLQITAGIGMFGGNIYERKSPKLFLEAVPLPAEGRPEGFNSANVGNFIITARAKAKNCAINQPLPIEFEISGQGNIEMVQPPKVKFPQWVKSYQPQITDSVEIRRFIVGGKKTIEYIIIPQKSGKLVVPPVDFFFFNPQEGQYKKVSTEPLEIEVSPSSFATGFGGSDESATQDNQDEKSEGLDKLSPIITITSLKPSSTEFIKSRWFMGAIGFPPFILCMIFLVGLVRITREKIKKASSLAPLSEARKVFKKALDFRIGSSEKFYGMLQKGIYRYLEIKFSIPATAMTTSELTKFLKEKSIDENLINKLVYEIENCEFARYGKARNPEEEARKSLKRIEKLLEQFERYSIKAGSENRRSG